MKGLLYKDFYLSGKKLLSIFFIYFIITLMGVLVCISMNCGNLAHSSGEELMNLERTMERSLYLPLVVFLVGAAGLVIENICCDFEVKWQDFMFASPLNGKRNVGVKFIFSAIIFVAAFVFGVLSYVIIRAVEGKNIQPEIFADYGIITLIIVFFSVFGMILSYQYRKIFAVQIRLVFTIGIIIAAFIFHGFLKWKKQGGDGFFSVMGDTLKNFYFNFKNVMAPFSFFIAAVVFIAGWGICIKIYDRRGKV